MDPARARRGRPRDPNVERKVRAAAAELLLERGVERTTVSDVADRAGVGKASVYRRYASKEELALDALAHLFDVEVSIPDTGSLRGDLVSMYRDTLVFAASPQGQAFVLLAAGEACRDDRVAALYRRSLDSRMLRTAVVVERAVSRGELPTDLDRQIFFDSLTGLLVLRAITRRAPIDPAEAERLVDVILGGFGPE